MVLGETQLPVFPGRLTGRFGMIFQQKLVNTGVSAETEATIVLGTRKCSGYMGSNPFLAVLFFLSKDGLKRWGGPQEHQF